MRFLELRLDIAPEHAEQVAELLGRVAGGVSIDRPVEATDHDGAWRYDPAHPHLAVRAYLPIDGSDPDRLAEVRRLLAAGGFDAPALADVDEADWAHAWKRFFRLLHTGRIVIRPPWRRYVAKPGEVVVDLDPGMAFGTGQHPTTRMCLRALQAAVVPGARVLDLGSGPGIHAIAAAKLGAREVVAVDTEPLAVDATRANARANGVAMRITALPGSLTAERAEPPFDVIVANVNLAGLRPMAPLLARATAPGGTLILSGLLAEGAATMATALRSEGMRIVRRSRGSDWRALVLRRR